MKKILFVCHGNICRSPMAEFVMKDLVKKAGLAPQFHIGMDSANLRNMHRICGGDFAGKLHLLMDYTDRPGDVADPWYTGDFEATWQDVLAGCQGLLREITGHHHTRE